METYSVTIKTRDGVTVWGGIAAVVFNPYALLLTEHTPDGGTHTKAGYAHGHWDSYQAILEAPAEESK